MADSIAYQRIIAVKAAPDTAYKALTIGYGDWWTTAASGGFIKIGDQVKFSFPPMKSFWVFESERLEPNHLVSLKCTKSEMVHTGEKIVPPDEWLDTRLVFEISNSNLGCEIKFTHEGLTSKLACYETCEAGWDHFFLGSLKQYLDTGFGNPHTENNQEIK